MTGTQQFDSALYGVGVRIREVLKKLPDTIKRKTEEIRLRAGLPVSLTVSSRPLFVLENGTVADFITRDLLTANTLDLEESFRLLCRESVYAHTAEIQNGFIMMSGGHRAGICGTVTQGGLMRDISSVNIRIAREVFGCASELIKEFDGGGMLIAGPPGSGKTTVLRDFVRQLSNGLCGRYYRVVVIDSRGELSGSYAGSCNNDLGRNTDVLLIPDKALGTQMAIRTMFPDVVVFDEIGTAAELKSVSDSLNAGVAVVTTAHIGKIEDITRRSVTNGLLRSGAISKIALLSGTLGSAPQILSTEDFLYDLDV